MSSSELVTHGHEVTALVRSEEEAEIAVAAQVPKRPLSISTTELPS